MFINRQALPPIDYTGNYETVDLSGLFVYGKPNVPEQSTTISDAVANGRNRHVDFPSIDAEEARHAKCTAPVVSLHLFIPTDVCYYSLSDDTTFFTRPGSGQATVNRHPGHGCVTCHARMY
jgi:hypothetical protein